MDSEFWLERWKNNQTKFHQASIHPLLIKHWPSLSQPRSSVFVPLCGKSKDMHWLQHQGLEVVGSELSAQAMNEFIEEHEITFTSREVGSFISHKAVGYRMIVGDFFNLNKGQIGEVDCVYDRAALVALPKEMRDQYVQQLQTLLSPGTEQLLITFEYDQSKREGPPFSIDQQEVERLYASWCDIELLESVETNEFQEIDDLNTSESCYKLTVN